jgi:hypothetical protein
MANNNRYGFLDLISKIIFLTHLYQSFNKFKNKHPRCFGFQYLHILFIFVYEEKKIWMQLQKYLILVVSRNFEM